MPEFSIHIAVYNCEKYIGQTLEALRADPDQALEILVFNDASQDHSVEIIKKAMEKDCRIRLIDSKVNYGIAGSRQRMLHETDARYIIVLDHDDILLPLPRKEYAELFQENDQLSAIYGKKRHVNEHLQDLNRYQGDAFSRFNLFHINMVCHPGSILRRSAVIKAGGYMNGAEGKKSRFGDFFLWSRLCTQGELLFANRYHLLYRTHSKQASHAQSSEVENNYVAKWILHHHSDLHKAITQEDSDISADKRRAAMLILASCAVTLRSNPVCILGC